MAPLITFLSDCSVPVAEHEHDLSRDGDPFVQMRCQHPEEHLRVEQGLPAQVRIRRCYRQRRTEAAQSMLVRYQWNGI